MIETERFELPNGITLYGRVAGPAGAPVLLFLHGFPEGAFAWDELLRHFGRRYRCVAPNLRGFGPSSAPADPALYRARHLMADIEALIGQVGAKPIEALVAHDWGGAVAWGIAAQNPELIRRLVIINSPHPGTFLRDLQHSPRQQAASAYMNFLCRPDAEKLLAADDFARLWAFFTCMGAADRARPGGGWLTDAMREQYRALWRAGLTGGCNYYRASALRPPTPQDASVMNLMLAPDRITSRRPTLVIWGEEDAALLPSLVEGLDVFVPELRLVRVPGATHWIVHERPQFIAAQIERHLAA